MDVRDLSDEEMERYRHMSIDEKLEEVCRLNRIEEERQRAEIRARYGDIPEEEMRWRVAALRYGRELVMKATGWDPESPAGQGPDVRRRPPAAQPKEADLSRDDGRPER